MTPYRQPGRALTPEEARKLDLYFKARPIPVPGGIWVEMAVMLPVLSLSTFMALWSTFHR